MPLENHPAAEARQPCPRCGSTHRTFHQSVGGTLKPRGSYRLKHKRPGHKRPLYEEKLVHKRAKASGREARERLIIDRERKRKIHQVDELTAVGDWERLHDEDEPLA
jgi:hypothetical protein